ncbi:hypothetical protein [Campylobacter lanienae]|uniref:hypothetical protein n=1 Tax=Campylobacter lanienae TaxID=75658 RepID=UPI0015D744B2|nr:hypothetical protein [Campylobacter lanienae]
MRGFSVCYFSTDFVRVLKVGKNRGTPRSGALGVFKGSPLVAKLGFARAAKIKIVGE